MIECLEERRHLAITLANGILNIPGTPRSDVIVTRIAGKSLVVTLNAVNSKYPLTKIRGVVINGNNGNDFIAHGAGAIPAKIIGGSGHDTLSGGLGDDTIIGAAGNDRIYGQAGDDLLDGGLGDDVIGGGPGSDTVTYADRSRSVSVDLGEGVGGETGESDQLTSIENIIGGAGNDILRGDSQNNLIRGGPGDDTITGQSGQDSLYGDAGDDFFDSADEQSDTVDGGDGYDTAYYDGEIDLLISIENAEGGYEV